MKEEKEFSTTLERIFSELLDELDKQPVSRDKAIELERRFIMVMNNTYGSSTINAEEKPEKRISDEITLDMNKLARDKSIFAMKTIPDKAATWASVLVLSAVGLLFITVGFLLIITPASPEFEIATLFYFNENDGFTVMDLIALVIVFIGIYFFLRAFVSKDKKY